MMPLDDEQFDRAWRAFAAVDAEERPSAALEARIVGALDERARGAAAVRQRRWWPVPAGAAVAAAVLIALLAPRRELSVTPEGFDAREDISSPAPDSTDAVVPAVPLVRPAPAALRRRAHRAPGRAEPSSTSAVLTLAADPIHDSEALQLVRLRLPRGALRTLGVGLLDPEADGIVEIDVLVGGDGLPRSVYPVRTVQESP
jgi:hypothetical protein